MPDPSYHYSPNKILMPPATNKEGWSVAEKVRHRIEDTMMNQSLTPNITNPIFRMHWAGWQSDSVTLQRNGWELAMERSVDSFSMRFHLHHPDLACYAVSADMVEDAAFRKGLRFGTHEIQDLEVGMKLAKDIVFRTVSPMKLRAINAEPTFIDTAQLHNVRLSDIWPFAKRPAKQEILVDPKDVNSMLQAILEEQGPRQKELREKYRREQRQEERHLREVHAEIVSIRDAA